MHIEMTRFDGRVVFSGLPIVRYTTEARLEEIIRHSRRQRLPGVQPASLYAGRGRHEADRPGATGFQARRPIRKGMLNPGKMVAWEDPDFDFAAGRAWLFAGLETVGRRLMRVHVVHAHPVETSYNRALFDTAVAALAAAGHQVDRAEPLRRGFHRGAQPRGTARAITMCRGNLTPAVTPYVDAPARGRGDGVRASGLELRLSGDPEGLFRPHLPARRLVHAWKAAATAASSGPRWRIKKVAFVTTYGGNRWRTWVMGDPPRRLARRWAWATFRTPRPPQYLALYDMNNQTPERLAAFQERVREAMAAF